MTRYRSLVAFVLILVTTFLIWVHPAIAAKAKTYTPAQLEQIQRYETNVLTLRQQMPELATLIENRQWTDVRSFIHGPLGELRTRMNYLTRTLLPPAQATATEAAQGVFGHLLEIDEAAVKQDYRQAIRNYAEAIKDFEAFFATIPDA